VQVEALYRILQLVYRSGLALPSVDYAQHEQLLECQTALRLHNPSFLSTRELLQSMGIDNTSRQSEIPTIEKSTMGTHEESMQGLMRKHGVGNGRVVAGRRSAYACGEEEKEWACGGACGKSGGIDGARGRGRGEACSEFDHRMCRVCDEGE